MQQLLSVVAASVTKARTEFARNRAQEQLRDIYQYIRTQQADYRDEFIEEMINFSAYEADFNADILNQVRIGSAIPTPEQLYTSMMNSIIAVPGSPGYSMAKMLREFDMSTINLIDAQVRDATALGYSNRELASRIESIAPSLGRRAATVARTATNHVSNQTRKMSMQENDDVIDGYEWVATLDSRTSLVCAARDGVIYRDLENDPKPPAHFNCRSTITMVVNPEFDLGAPGGTRPSIGPDGVKQVAASTTYENWLRLQPESFQEKVLGKTRARLFREKKLTLDKFVDSQGNVLSLRELGIEDIAFNNKKPPEIIPPAVSKTSILNGVTNMSDVPTEVLEKSVAGMSDDIIQAAERLPKLVFVEQAPPGQAYADVTRRRIAQSTSDAEEVFRHEYGHHMDWQIAKERGKYGFISSLDSKFGKAFLDDKKALNLRATATQRQRLSELRDEVYEIYEDTSGPEAINRRRLRTTNHMGIADIIDAMVNGVARSNYGWHGHGKSYFSSKENRLTEVFANMVMMRNDPVTWAKCRRLFPSITKRFDEIIMEVISGT